MSGSSSEGSRHIQDHFLGMENLVVNWDTIYCVWGVMILVVLGSWLITNSLKKQSIGNAQFLLESIYDIWDNQVTAQIQWKAHKFLPLIGGIFVFCLFGYWHGLLPWKIGALHPLWPQLDNGHPFEGAAPTSDINVTVGLAIVSVIAYLSAGTMSAKLSYWAPYFGFKFHHGKLSFDPLGVITGSIEWLDLILRPLTLSLRLFANTFAGEALLVELVKMTYFIIPIPILIFEFGIGIIQAFIFAILTTVYIGIATSHGADEHGEDEEEAETGVQHATAAAH